jgi:hypothetical protein
MVCNQQYNRLSVRLREENCALPGYSFDGSGRLKCISLGFNLFEDCKTARNHLTVESKEKAEVKLGERK